MGGGGRLTGRSDPLGRRLEYTDNPVPLLLTGVRHHPPGRTDKNLCRCFGAPARRGFPDHLITYMIQLVQRRGLPPLFDANRPPVVAPTLA